MRHRSTTYDREDVVQATLQSVQYHPEFGRDNETKCKLSTLVIKCWMEKHEGMVRKTRNQQVLGTPDQEHSDGRISRLMFPRLAPQRTMGT